MCSTFALAAAAQPACPASIVTTQGLGRPLAGWTETQLGTESVAVHVEFSQGDDPLDVLPPDEQLERDGVEMSRWTMSDYLKKVGVTMTCMYQNTRVVIRSKIPDAVNTCWAETYADRIRVVRFKRAFCE